jgi:hypothetical protein
MGKLTDEVEKRRRIGQSIFFEDTFVHHQAIHRQGDLLLGVENIPSEILTMNIKLHSRKRGEGVLCGLTIRFNLDRF